VEKRGDGKKETNAKVLRKPLVALGSVDSLKKDEEEPSSLAR